MNDVMLSIHNLSKSFGRRKVIDGLSFEVKAGEVFGLLGPNGAGKTTSIKMLMGFLHPDEGDIVINGVDLRQNYEKAMGYLGGIVENPEMYKNLSGRMNLKMYARLHDNIPAERIDEVISLVGMEGRSAEKVKRYSLGMKQRIGLAQSLVHQPRLLILDEPTNGLDPAGIRELRDILKNLAHKEGVAVMVSSHILSEMQIMCDRVAIIDQGRLLGIQDVVSLSETAAGVGEAVYHVQISDALRARQLLPEHLRTQAEAKSDEVSVLMLRCDEAALQGVLLTWLQAGLLVRRLTPVEMNLEDVYFRITGGGMHIA